MEPVQVRHAPADYQCAFCTIGSGGNAELTTQADVVMRSDLMTAFVASHWWPANPGHVLVIPNKHIENLYELPDELGGALMRTVRQVAVAMKVVYGCDGVSTRQHNEPAGYQDVWHFHQHVFPRWDGDQLYERHSERALAGPTATAERAALLRSHLRA